MKQLLFTSILVLLVTACTVRGPNPDPEVSKASGEVAFGPLAGMDKKQYLFEQHALFRNLFYRKGVDSSIRGDTLILDISGNITFTINSAKMNWNVQEILNQITPVIKEYQHTSILVLGNSDARGDKVINQRLSEQRANVVRDYFVRSGIDPWRIIARGMGDDELLIQDDVTTMDRALNRRIVLEITVNPMPEEMEEYSLTEEISNTDVIEDIPAIEAPEEVPVNDIIEEQWLDKPYDN